MNAADPIMSLPTKRLSNYCQSPTTGTSLRPHPALDAAADVQQSKYFLLHLNFIQAISGWEKKLLTIILTDDRL